MVSQQLVAWLKWGSDRSASFSHRRKIIQLNATAVMTLGVVCLFAVAYAMSDNAALRRMALFQLPVIVITASIPWLNRQGRHDLARWGLLLSVTALVAAGTWLSSGSYLRLHTIYIAVATAAVVLFPVKDWRSAGFVVVLNIGLYCYTEFVGMAPAADLFPLSDGTYLMFHVAHLATTIFSVLCIVWVGELAVRRNELTFAELSGVDQLTGLPNRRRVLLRLSDAIAMSKRIRQYVAVLFLDLDNFKPLNDAHGHEAGDLLLREVARRLQAIVREVDLAARLGGDEFVAVISHLGSDPAEAHARMRRVSEQVRDAIAQPYRIPTSAGAEVVHHCTASIGVALFVGAEADPESLLQRADAAMYRAKAAGRNQVRFDVEH